MNWSQHSPPRVHHPSRGPSNRLKMLIDGINKNRYRIESIFRRLYEAQDDQLSILKGLVREGLLSDKQFEKLIELDVSDLPAVALVIKDMMVAQGVKFLPNTMKSLRESLCTLSKELIDTGLFLCLKNFTDVKESLINNVKQ